MIDETTIQTARAVDMDLILDEFGWEKNKYGQIRCPHPSHNDSTPSCSYSADRNKFKCFGCGESFDTIDLYQCLNEKVSGRVVPFYKAVDEILELDAMAGGNKGSAGGNSNQYLNTYHSSNQSSSNYGNSSQRTKVCQPQNNIKCSSPYELITRNSKPISGYELNYLHSRGIMLYDSYVYKGEVHTTQNLDKALQETADQQEIDRLLEIKNKGVFYKGIAAILKANRIQIRHNYYQGVNSIIYQIDYAADTDDDLCDEQFFRDTERHMAIQKTLDGNHIKRALGTSDFNFITRGMEQNSPASDDIYICEGVEDSLSCVMNGIRCISLNSTANLKSLMHYLSEDYFPSYHRERFVICFDHDESGQRATKELADFFDAYTPIPPRKWRYDYAVCSYPQQFHDINDYWVSKVFQ